MIYYVLPQKIHRAYNSMKDLGETLAKMPFDHKFDYNKNLN